MAAGHRVDPEDHDARFHTDDPWGNRLELLAPIPLAVPGERERIAAELRSVADRLAGEPHLRRESETLRRVARTLD